MKYIKAIKIISLTVLIFMITLDMANAQQNSFALRGGKIHTVTGAVIENGIIVVENGKITGIGSNLDIPDGMKIYDITGKEVTPGFIDEHSHLGNYTSDDDVTGVIPIAPENRALDAMHLDIPDWMNALSGGVTTVVTGPGSGMRSSGQSITIKTFGENLEKRILREADIKMAFNSRSFSHLTNIRSAFIQAQEYMEKWDKWESGDKKGSPPKRDLKLETLSQAIKGEKLVRAHIYTPMDMMTLMKIKDDFGFDLNFIHSVEAWKIADEVAKHNVGCILMPLAMYTGGNEDQLRGTVKLYEAGVRIAMHTDHPVAQQKWLRLGAGLTMRYGLPEEAALKSLTIFPAEMGRVDKRIGSIEVGKDADIVVFNGPWYEFSSRIEHVFVDGVLAYSSKNDDKVIQEDK